MSAPDIARLDASASSVALPTMLSDGELLTATRRLVGRSNQLLALLLGHLAEVESRRLHRTRACSSLYTYCIYELRFSEDEAFRRVAAARLVRRFPALFDAIASGELHLTGLLMLGPHLTSENLTEVLTRAKHRTKKEIARLVRQLDPLPDVPARIEPLGPALARVTPATPTYSEFVESMCPVRELPVGDRPRDWADDAARMEDTAECSNDVGVFELVATAPVGFASTHSLAPCNTPDALSPASAHSLESCDTPRALGAQPEDKVSALELPALELPAPARLEPQRYRVQFTAGEEYVKLVEEAQALLSHSAERIPLDELQLRAMRALVADLRRKRRAATKGPGTSSATGVDATDAAIYAPTAPTATRTSTAPTPTHATRATATAPSATLLLDQSVSERGASGPGLAERNERRASERRLAERNERRASEPSEAGVGGSTGAEHSRQRGRHVPAAVRRAVFERDQERCAYIDSTGQRCRETQRLELHHLRAFAMGGEHSVENLALRCRSHNALASEEDFGAAFVERSSQSSRHESCSQQTRTIGALTSP